MIGKSVHTCATQTCLFIKILCYCNLHLQHLNEECHKLEMLVIYIYISIYMYVSVLILKNENLPSLFCNLLCLCTSCMVVD